MNYRFDASHIFFQDDGCAVIIGFADDEFEPSRFIILQKAHKYDDQDRKMGMDKIHIQVESESRSKYGGIEAVQVSNGVIRISLSDESKSILSLDGDIEIVCLVDGPNFQEVKLQLKKICEIERIMFVG